MYVIRSDRYPELTTYGPDGAGIRFREGLYETSSRELAEYLDAMPHTEIVGAPAQDSDALDLPAMSRKDLDEHAASLGIDASALPNKAAVIEAIRGHEA